VYSFIFACILDFVVMKKVRKVLFPLKTPSEIFLARMKKYASCLIRHSYFYVSSEETSNFFNICADYLDAINTEKCPDMANFVLKEKLELIDAKWYALTYSSYNGESNYLTYTAEVWYYRITGDEDPLASKMRYVDILKKV